MLQLNVDKKLYEALKVLPFYIAKSKEFMYNMFIRYRIYQFV